MNLLKETIAELRHHNKTLNDVLWIGCKNFTISKDNFIQLADNEYDCGFGTQEVADDLVIVGEDWWLERIEYVGSESWVFKTLPFKPREEKIITALTIHQKKDSRCGWCTLNELNFDSKEGVYCEDEEEEEDW